MPSQEMKSQFLELFKRNKEGNFDVDVIFDMAQAFKDNNGNSVLHMFSAVFMMGYAQCEKDAKIELEDVESDLLDKIKTMMFTGGNA